MFKQVPITLDLFHIYSWEGGVLSHHAINAIASLKLLRKIHIWFWQERFIDGSGQVSKFGRLEWLRWASVFLFFCQF